MNLKEEVTRQLESFTEAELHEVVKYLAFLRYKSRIAPRDYDEQQLATLYGEFAEEDRMLAEEGIADYASALTKEDAE